MKIEIDVEEFAEKIRSGKGLSGKDGALTDLVKQITEITLQAELESHLAQDLQKNRKNGYTSKTMKTEHGAFELQTPRDRNGSFEPQVVKKSQTHLSDEIEKKMLSLFSLGSSYSQITEHIEDIYGVHFSKPAITAVTDKLIPMLDEWKKSVAYIEPEELHQYLLYHYSKILNCKYTHVLSVFKQFKHAVTEHHRHEYRQEYEYKDFSFVPVVAMQDFRFLSLYVNLN